MRIVVYCERLVEPFDEGIKNVALQLIQALRGEHEVRALTSYGADHKAYGVRNVPSNPLALSPWLARAVRRFAPDLTIYIPTAAATPMSFFRSRMLRLYGRHAPVALVALQVRSYAFVARCIMPRCQPDVLVAQGPKTLDTLEELGCRVQMLSPAVDVERFHPRCRHHRDEVLAQLGLVAPGERGASPRIALHVGHLNRGRNLQALIPIQAFARVQVVVVGSGSTPHDESLVRELQEAGVCVVAEHIPDIEQVYGAADCYVFPAEGANSAIDIPLSVLEAMATDLPVVTTRFGGLPTHFGPSASLRYVDDMVTLAEMVSDVLEAPQRGNRALVEPYTWQRAAGAIVAHLHADGREPAAGWERSGQGAP